MKSYATFTVEQLATADAVDDLEVGSGIDIAPSDSLKGGFIERESPTRYTVNRSEPMCFIEACDAVFIR